MFEGDAHLQRLQEAKGAQASPTWHQTEGGVVEEFLVIEPAEKTNSVFILAHIDLISYADDKVIYLERV